MGNKDRWVFYDDADEAIEDGITRQTMGYYVADAEKDARAAFWIRGDAERYIRERNREQEAGFVLSIGLGNAAMSTGEDVGEALKGIAQCIADGERDGNVFDENGNTVGHWTLNEPEPPHVMVAARDLERGQWVKIGDDSDYQQVETTERFGEQIEVILFPHSEGVLVPALNEYPVLDKEAV